MTTCSTRLRGVRHPAPTRPERSTKSEKEVGQGEYAGRETSTPRDRCGTRGLRSRRRRPLTWDVAGSIPPETDKVVPSRPLNVSVVGSTRSVSTPL